MPRRTTFGLAALGFLVAALAPSVAVAAAPAVGLSATTIDFGSSPWLVAAPTQTLTVTNTGDAPLAISTVDLSGQPFVPADFMVFLSGCEQRTLAPGAQCQEQIRFTPQSGGPRAVTLTVWDDAADSPQAVRLTGAGTGAVVAFAPRTLDFGTVLAGTTSSRMALTAVNSGDGPVTISGVALGPAPWFSTWFGITSDACTGKTLTPGDRCALSLDVAPTAVGSGTQEVLFTDSAGTGQQTFSQVFAYGGGPSASIIEVPRFAQAVGTTSTVTPIQVFDGGTQPLAISSVDFDNASAGFSIVHDGCSGTSLALNVPFHYPPPLCEVDVTFAPSAASSFSANLVVHDNAFGGSNSFTINGTGYAPGAVLSTSSIDFGFVPVGGAPSQRTVTLTNPTPQALTVSSISVATQQSGRFDVANDTCSGATVAAGGTCTFVVELAPLFPYLALGTVTVRDSAAEPAPTITLRGEGDAPTFTISSDLLDFGDQHVNVASAPLTFDVTNTSAQTMTFGFLTGDGGLPWSGCGSPVAPGASCTVSLTITPHTVGTQTALFKVVDPQSNQQVVEVHWAGTTGAGRIEGDSLTNIAQQVGASETRTAVLINGGSGKLAVGQVTLSNTAPVAITADGCSGQTLEVHGTCNISLTMHPTSAGSWYTTLTVPTDAALGANPVTAYVSGTAGTSLPIVTLPGSYAFPAQHVGAAETTKVIWFEDGVEPTYGALSVSVASTAISGPDASSFRVVWDGCSGTVVDPAYSCPVEIGFDPTKGAPLNASLVFNDDGANAPQAVALSGTGLAAIAQISPASVSFGSILLRSKSAPATITLTNAGNSALHIGKETLSGAAKGDYTITSENCQNQTLAPGASCQVVLVFRPSVLGTRPATLTLVDDALDSPQVVPITGTGVSK